MARIVTLALLVAGTFLSVTGFLGAPKQAHAAESAHRLRAELALLSALERLAEAGVSVPAEELTASLGAIEEHVNGTLPVVQASDRERLVADIDRFSESAALAAMAYSVGEPEAGASYETAADASFVRLHGQLVRVTDRASERADRARTIALTATVLTVVSFAAAVSPLVPPAGSRWRNRWRSR